MSENCTHDCSSCGEECPSRQNPESFLAPMNKMSNVKKVIGVVSGKGGVGKSLVTSMLAVTMQRRGFKTAILDADITGRLSRSASASTKRPWAAMTACSRSTQRPASRP